ncbi:hypothetical protein B7494_g5708 [Chlorociboria aeruginascens]|nr:hypothetical protein B7494_g5708 [Chlorociboria aeruginascens]
MEGQPVTYNSQHKYQSAQWSRLVRRNTLAGNTPSSSPSLAGASQLPTLDLLPILLPQRSSFDQAQLAQYNRLISAGRGSRLQSSPLPPLLSAPHIQAVPGSRSGSSGGNTERKNQHSARGGHGNKDTRKFGKGERALITGKESVTMPAKKFELSNQLPARPHPQHQTSSLSQQSSSVPSTPHQHARKFSFESREPSPSATISHSPRSVYSESNITLPSARPLPPPRGGCRYETAMVHTRRRMAYSIGDERLGKLNLSDIKSKLSKDEERKLSTDMRELYDRLLPTSGSDSRRRKLVEKLENLFNNEWPGHNIRVHVFGSSGNLLCTDDSDVDICITTDWKEMEGVCIIAELLAKSGMEKVICVSNAKVPIVKIWDPELRLACDMNVNNTLALENTRMIKTYVEIDPRVRPLAMIIKHWTKRRIVNDAAFGGTLSSYTWICMIINFLQTRAPPILPALHQRPHLILPNKDGPESSFADNLDALRNFGQKNQESLGDLLFSFFRFYAHEFDYDKLVISVRSGKQISKVDKKWHVTTNNTLCVEEPFNVSRNLGNTADGYSFRGLHIELRRAFDLISVSKLAECCELYEFPKEEERVTYERPAAKPKPILRSTSQSSRGGRGGSHRGARSNISRNGNNNRRASSGAFESSSNTYLPPALSSNLSAHDVWMQQQAQAQLHNQLYTTYSVLQAQENNLRLQLYSQSFATESQPYNQGRNQGNAGVNSQHHPDRSRTSSFDQPPLTAPLRPEVYYYPLHYQGTPVYGYQNPSTNPSSPSLSAAVPELRRSMHRSTVTNGSGASGHSNSSLRSHSQPAVRSAPTQFSIQGAGVPNHANGLGIYQPMRQAHGVAIPNFLADENLDSSFEKSSQAFSTTPPEESAPREYVGYYVCNPAPNSMRKQSVQPLAVPSFGDVGQSRRRLSTDQLPQSILDRLKRSSRSPSPSPLGHDRSFSTGAHSAPMTAAPSQQGTSYANIRPLHTGPLVANGSNSLAPVFTSNGQTTGSEGSAYGDHSSDIAIGSTDSQDSRTGSEISDANEHSGQVTPKEPSRVPAFNHPLVVDGSTPRKNGSVVAYGPSHEVPSQSDNPSDGSMHMELPIATTQLSPKGHSRSARQTQNAGIPPLDMELSQHDVLREILPHLSPVYEARSPSPVAHRKAEAGTIRSLNGVAINPNDGKAESPSSGSRLSPTNGNQIKQSSSLLKPNGHTRASKSEGGGTGSWQKISKNKKKGPGGELKSAGNGLPHSEMPPMNDSERKGG